MTLAKTQKLAAHIYRLLKVKELSFPIGRTDKGDLNFRFRKDQDDYEIVLDAVPLNMSETDHTELKGLLEKYLFDKEEVSPLYMGNPVDTAFVPPIQPPVIAPEPIIEPNANPTPEAS